MTHVAPRPGLSEPRVIDAAIELVDQEGLESLSLATLAKKLEIKPPSLYNHIEGLTGLRRAMTLRALEDLGTALSRAAVGRAGFDALASLTRAYREFATRHPGLYPLTQRTIEDDPELQQASWAVVEVVLAVLRGYGLEHHAAIHAARCLRSALHGFVSLELNEGFGLPLELEQSFEHLITMMDLGLKGICAENPSAKHDT